jgi:lipopolysaccharide export system permease protein
MIILRYLSRELLQTTLAVTVVLMVIIMSGRFAVYLAEAAAGKFDVAILFTLLFYRLPGFLELIVPLGFMVAILMAYGRLYAEHEMTVLYCCGMSQQKLVAYTYLPALLVALISGTCSLWLTPLGLQKTEQIFQAQKQRNELDTMKAGQFQIFGDGKLVSYAEEQNKNQQLQNVFIATMGVAEGEAAITVRAESAQRIEHPDHQQRYLQLNNGIRYEGRPGEVDYRVTHFDQFGEHIVQAEVLPVSTKKINMRPTAELFTIAKPNAQAALQWRLSAPLLIIVITLLGVTLSHTTPRRGRYVMLFPAILVYLVYVVMLNIARGAIEEKTLSPALGLWLVHGLFFGIALVLFTLRTGVVKRWLASFNGRSR